MTTLRRCLSCPRGLPGVVAQAALSTGAGRIAAREHVSGAALIPITQECFFGSCFAARPLVIRTRAVSPCNEGHSWVTSAVVSRQGSAMPRGRVAAFSEPARWQSFSRRGFESCSRAAARPITTAMSLRRSWSHGRTTRDFGSTTSRLIGSRASTRTGSRTATRNTAGTAAPGLKSGVR